MEVGHSDSIRVSLVQIAGQVYTPTIEIAGHTVVAATPLLFGTPSVPLERALGTEYEAYASAYLAAAAFGVMPVTSEEQSLGQSTITWEWNIAAEKDGVQAVNLSMEVEWRPVDGGQTVRRQVWRARIEIAVEKPLISTGQVSIVTLISGIAGSGLSIPFVYERVKDRGARQQAGKGAKRRAAPPRK